MPNTQELVETISNMTVKELVELVEALKEKFGVSGVPVVAGPAAAAPAEESKEEEKATVSVILVSPGDQKVPVVKLIKQLMGVGLKEARDIVENLPKPIKEGISREEAEEIKQQFAALGAQVEIK